MIDLCTRRPAAHMGLLGEIGCLSEGARADVAVFRREESRIAFGDRPYGHPDGRAFPCDWRLRAMLTVKDGEMVYRDELF